MSVPPPYTHYVPLSRIDTAFVYALVVVGLDAVTTSLALYTIPGAREANPVIAGLIAVFGVAGAMFVKVVAGSLLAMWLTYCAEWGYPFRWMQRNWRFKPVPRMHTCRRAYRMLVVMIALHGVVVVNNFAVIIIRS